MSHQLFKGSFIALWPESAFVLRDGIPDHDYVAIDMNGTPCHATSEEEVHFFPDLEAALKFQDDHLGFSVHRTDGLSFLRSKFNY